MVPLCSRRGGTGLVDDELKEENSMKKLALALVLVVALVSQCALAEAEEPVTLSILVCRNAAVNVPAEENEAWKYAAEQNGVVLEFTEIDSSAWNERFNVMLAGGDLPDIITK